MTTVELHPEFISKNGEREFAVLAYGEYLALEEWIEDVEDLLEIREETKNDTDAPNMTLQQVEEEFGITAG